MHRAGGGGATRPFRLAAPIALCALAAGCHHQYLEPRLFAQVRQNLPEAPSAETLEVRFLSVQGFAIRWRSTVVMTPPLYSNPPLEAVLAGNADLPRKDALVRSQLRPEWVRDAAAILVGHSHYDHLMDVPYISKEFAPGATIYGSTTAANLLEASGVPRSRLTALNADDDNVVDYRPCAEAPAECCVFKAGSEGRWLTIAGGRARIRALCSRHSPQFARLPVSSQGCERTVPARPPHTADSWKLGDTLAYLIDFLDEDGAVAFRVYYQDSPTAPRFGYLPDALARERRVDVALLCAGGFNQVDDNPRGILANAKPRHVLLGHWENFFEPLSGELHTLVAFDLNELRRRMEQARAAVPAGAAWDGEFWFPTPGQLFVFDRARPD